MSRCMYALFRLAIISLVTTKLVNKIKLQLLNIVSSKVLTRNLQCVWFGMGLIFCGRTWIHTFLCWLDFYLASCEYLSPADSAHLCLVSTITLLGKNGK